MNKYGLIGKDISYSLSPFIHNYLAENFNINMQYNLIDLESLVDINLLNYNGLNVTTPYKEEIIKYVSTNMSNYRSINTLVNKTGEIHGYNTDIIAFDMFLNHEDIEIVRVAILGTGGVAHTLKQYFDEKNVSSMLISRKTMGDFYSYDDLDNLKPNFIINTTPLGQGMYKGISPLSSLDSSYIEYILDFNYTPFHSKLLLDAKSNEIKTFNGLDILIRQAIYSFEIWNDIKVPNNLYIDLFLNVLVQNTKGLIVYGMPFSGKSTECKMLKEKYPNSYIYDLDEVLEKNIGNIGEYIDVNGIEMFRLQEQKYLNVLLENNDKFIIIFAGGGTFINKNIISALQNYVLVYLNKGLNDLIENFEITSHRPHLNSIETLKKIYEKRKHIYNQIHDYEYDRAIIEKIIIKNTSQKNFLC